MARRSWEPTLNSHDFWVDYVRTSMGTNPQITDRIVAVFEAVQPWFACVLNVWLQVDSFKMPRPADWVSGLQSLLHPCDADRRTWQFQSRFSSMRVAAHLRFCGDVFCPAIMCTFFLAFINFIHVRSCQRSSEPVQFRLLAVRLQVHAVSCPLH